MDQFNDPRLDYSELQLIYRAIESAGKDPRDPKVLAEYKAGYLRMLRAMRMMDWQPAPGARLN